MNLYVYGIPLCYFEVYNGREACMCVSEGFWKWCLVAESKHRLAFIASCERLKLEKVYIQTNKQKITDYMTLVFLSHTQTHIQKHYIGHKVLITVFIN